MDGAGHAEKSDRSHQNVDGGVDYVDDEDSDSRSSSRKSGPQPESDEDSEVGGVGIVENVEELNEEEKEGNGRPRGADPNTRQVKIDTRD